LEKTQVFIVDASVAVKWYVKEEMREKALRLRDEFVSGLIDLEAPSLILYEVGNALRHHPATTAADCAEAVRQLQNLGLVVHELDDTLIDTAANLAFDEKLTFYDGVYLALAKSLEAKLVTADQKLRDQLSHQNRSRIMLLNDYGQMP
jgi:predicted nucleic acid-binding protein